MFKGLVPWTPFENMRGVAETMEKALRGAFRGVGLKETPTELVVTAQLPGVRKHDIELDVSETGISIRATGRRSSFYRAMTLPCAVKPKEAKAAFNDGVLKVTLPKVHESRLNRIRID